MADTTVPPVTTTPSTTLTTGTGSLTRPIRQPKWTWWHTVGMLLILVATALVGWFIPFRLTSWLITMALLLLLISIAANGVTGNWRGPLIDERNRISLSRFQMLIWTVLLLSALLTAILSNLKASAFAPAMQFEPMAQGINNLVSVNIPSGLWVLMGIATTSFVGAPLILSTKTTRSADPQEKQQTLQQLARQRVDVNPDNVVDNGQVLAYTTANNARWADLFTGDETGNAAQFDLGKIQMFYFTFILVLIYGLALGLLFQSATPIIKGFPDLDTGMLTLLGISHTGYLLNKAVPHSSDQQTQ